MKKIIIFAILFMFTTMILATADPIKTQYPNVTVDYYTLTNSNIGCASDGTSVYCIDDGAGSNNIFKYTPNGDITIIGNVQIRRATLPVGCEYYNSKIYCIIEQDFVNLGGGIYRETYVPISINTDASGLQLYTNITFDEVIDACGFYSGAFYCYSSDKIRKYDIGTDTWSISKIGLIPSPTFISGGVALQEDTLWYFMDEPVNVFSYNITADTITEYPNFPIPIYGYAFFTIHNSIIYEYGGYNISTVSDYQNAIRFYDINTQEFGTSNVTLGTPVNSGMASKLNANEDIYVGGSTINYLFGYEASKFTYAEPCTPSWSCSQYSACIGTPFNHKNCLAVADANTCGEDFDGSLTDYTSEDCTIKSTSNAGAIIVNQQAAKQEAAITNPIEHLILNFRSWLLGLFGVKP